jgi:hypothetical protein
MLVWGGLHDRHVIGQLELMDLDTHEWISVSHTGPEPSARFGHTCTPLLRSDKSMTADRFVFIGGSDGNDLLRSGQEFYDIHVLTLVPRGRDSEEDKFVWSHIFPTGNIDLLPGRCHK